MKMKFFRLILIVASGFTNPAFAIVNGRDISLAEMFQFRSYVSLTEDRTGGGGVHIGDGLILTAFHIFEDITQTLTIRDVTGAVVTTFAIDKEKHIRIPDFRVKLSDGAKMQVPDLAIVVPDRESREKIKKLPVAKLSSVTESSILKMVGIGHTDFNGTENNSGFRPKIGEFKLQQDPGNGFAEFNTAYQPEKIWANGAPRDSGSPLWEVSKDDRELSVVGVAVAIINKPDTAEDKEAITVFLSLEPEKIKRWVYSVQKKSNQNNMSGACHLLF